MIVLVLAVYSACISIVVTHLTGVGEFIGFKPFNCYICLAWWLGIAHSLLGVISYDCTLLDVIGCGGLSAVLSYFGTKLIFRQ